MTRPIIPTLPPYPVRGEPREDFANKANDTVAAMPTVVTQMNAMSAWVDGVSDDCEAAQTAAEAAAAAAAGSANFVGEWSTLTGALAIPASVSHNDRVWVLTVSLADVTLKEPGVDPEWIEAFPQLDPIRLPENVTPASGATNVTDTILEGKPFYSLYGVAHSASQWQVSATSNFSGALVVNTGDVAATNTYDIGPGILSLSTSYYWRHRYKDIEGTYSDWSVATQFTVAAGIIDRPTMTTPLWGATNVPERAIMRVDAFTTSPALIDTHLSTSWEILRDSDGAVIHQSLNDTGNLLRYDVPSGILAANTLYRFRARFHGNTIAKSLWREIKATTEAVFGYGVYFATTTNGVSANTGSRYFGGVNVDTFTNIDSNVSLGTEARGTAFSADGKYLAICVDDSPYILIYKRTVDAVAPLAAPETLPTGSGRACAFDATGTYLAVAHNTSPYITIYKRAGDVFTKLANPATLPTGEAVGVAWEQDSSHLIVAHNTSPRMTVYARSGDTFTKLADPGTVIANNWEILSYVGYPNPVVAVSGTTYVFATPAFTGSKLSIYQRSGSTITKTGAPDIIPEGTPYCVAFNRDGNRLFVGQNPTGGGSSLIWYDNAAGVMTRKANPFVSHAYGFTCMAVSGDFDSERVLLGTASIQNNLFFYKISADVLGYVGSITAGTVYPTSIAFAPSALYGDD